MRAYVKVTQHARALLHTNSMPSLTFEGENFANSHKTAKKICESFLPSSKVYRYTVLSFVLPDHRVPSLLAAAARWWLFHNVTAAHAGLCKMLLQCMMCSSVCLHAPMRHSPGFELSESPRWPAWMHHSLASPGLSRQSLASWLDSFTQYKVCGFIILICSSFDVVVVLPRPHTKITLKAIKQAPPLNLA